MSIAVLYICRIVVSETRNTIASSFQLHKFAHPSHTSLPSQGAWTESFYPRPLETSEMAKKAGRVGHYQATKLVEQNVDGFIQQMAKSAGGQVRRTASMTVAGITKSQPERSKIRYARVLQGPESCGWCFMLASRGFVYRSEEAASHSHRGCKCIVMAGRESDTIEGYDLEGIQKRYDKVVEACGYDVFIDKDTRFDQLSREDYDCIARFAELHDPAWLYSNRETSWDKLDGAEPSPTEIRTADYLVSKGIKSTFLPTRAREQKRTPDVRFSNGKGWDFKNPIGDGKNNINNQFNGAVGQARNIVIDARESPKSFEDVIDAAQNRLNRDPENFDSAIIIHRDGFRYLERNVGKRKAAG